MKSINPPALLQAGHWQQGRGKIIDRLFLFDRDPDLGIIIFIIGSLRILVRRVIHLNAVSCRKFIILQCGKPFREYLCIDVLQCIRERATAGENRPCKRRDHPYGKPVRNICRRMIHICDQIFKGFLFLTGTAILMYLSAINAC